MDLLTPGRGYWETLAELERRQQQNNARLSTELGWRLNQQHSLFGRGWADTSGDVGVGIGYRFEF